jgi:hypothetical protein
MFVALAAAAIAGTQTSQSVASVSGFVTKVMR